MIPGFSSSRPGIPNSSVIDVIPAPAANRCCDRLQGVTHVTRSQSKRGLRTRNQLGAKSMPQSHAFSLIRLNESVPRAAVVFYSFHPFVGGTSTCSLITKVRQ
ncbi:hypothetical protein CIPAW_12G102200 [Carya illinoinensis]|uniref:Uncharacterized protein n=1 Tax=Carya illinoinensis TaxID=32201 RepID=A0A8T1NY52_CARIL|nr:hypothetical protein CIPAW_12G102200 [Carya illinoinensis]